MATAALSKLARNIEIADQLRARWGTEYEPQELPEPFGGVVRAVDSILELIDTPAVLCGDWAVWRYGNPRRISDDLDILLPRTRIAEFVQAATAHGFSNAPAGRRSRKVLYPSTNIEVDVLWDDLVSFTGGECARLRFIDLASLVLIKLAANRTIDRSDVVELLLARPDQIAAIRDRAVAADESFGAQFDELANYAAAERDV